MPLKNPSVTQSCAVPGEHPGGCWCEPSDYLSNNPGFFPTLSSNVYFTSFPSHLAPRTSKANTQAMRKKHPQTSRIHNRWCSPFSTATSPGATPLQFNAFGSSCLHSSSLFVLLGSYQTWALNTSCLDEGNNLVKSPLSPSRQPSTALSERCSEPALPPGFSAFRFSLLLSSGSLFSGTLFFVTVTEAVPTY